MARRTTSTIEAEARDALVSALNELGVDASPGLTQPLGDRDGPDFTVLIGDQVLSADVKPVVTEAESDRVVRRLRRWGGPAIVVADRIADEAKLALRKAGINYLDRRGDLRLVLPSMIIDARVPGSLNAAPVPSDVLSSQVAREVAIACLLTPDQPHGIREVAAFIERAPSAVSSTMAGLREVGLLTSNGEPAVPDLFHELSVRWRRHAVALADLPRPGRGKMNAQLELGLEEVDTTLGWALTDTLGAAAWSMPVVARGDYPPDFYVPTDAALRQARALLGEAPEPGRRACTVAVAPVRLACLRRHNLDGEVWPVANHVVVALDIATDRARGSEILDQWHPKGIVRAW